MSTKHRLTISLLLLFMAISSTVYADHNYQHRPNQPAEYGALAQVGPPAPTDKAELPRRRSLQPVGSRKACSFQGGPKSGMWACRYTLLDGF
jgi:hypothetical protein